MKIDNNEAICSIFLDLSKAFDSVNHQILLQKVYRYGMVFPSNGSKAILKTNPLSIQCGVPQGSTLGPLLFLTFMNDMPNCLVKANIRTLADDTTLFYSSNSLQELEKTINEEFNHLLSYCTTNKLSVNFNKTYFNYDNLLPSKN